MVFAKGKTQRGYFPNVEEEISRAKCFNSFDTIIEDYEASIQKHLKQLTENPVVTPQPQSSSAVGKQGCYIATCVYGSYDCPEVWTLRRFRDNTLRSSWYGRFFVKVYYAISPKLVEKFGESKRFRLWWKKALDRLVGKLELQGLESTPYQDK